MTNLKEGDRVLTPGGVGTIKTCLVAVSDPNKFGSYVVNLDNSATFHSSLYPAKDVFKARNFKNKVIFSNPEYRSVMALILKTDKSARKNYKILMRYGTWNFLPDYRLDKNASGTYDRSPDFGAWNCSITRFGDRGSLQIALIRHGENDWTLHS